MGIMFLLDTLIWLKTLLSFLVVVVCVCGGRMGGSCELNYSRIQDEDLVSVKFFLVLQSS